MDSYLNSTIKIIHSSGSSLLLKLPQGNNNSSPPTSSLSRFDYLANNCEGEERIISKYEIHHLIQIRTSSVLKRERDVVVNLSNHPLLSLSLYVFSEKDF